MVPAWQDHLGDHVLAGITKNLNLPLSAICPSGMVVLDIGANEGFYTLFWPDAWASMEVLFRSSPLHGNGAGCASICGSILSKTSGWKGLLVRARRRNEFFCR